MIGTPDKPWIDLEPFIDLDVLSFIELDIMQGICISDSVPSAFSNLLDEDKVDPFEIESKPETFPEEIRRRWEEIRSSVPDRIKRVAASRQFLIMSMGVHTAGYGVSIRVPASYDVKNQAASCIDSRNIANFPTLMEFIGNLPFTEVGRIHIFINYPNCPTPIHTDGWKNEPHTNEFIWMTTNRDKQFFVYDRHSDIRHHITSRAAFFDERTWHGSEPSSKMAFSIRVDGFFTEEFREQIGIAGLTDYRGPLEV